MNFQLNFTISPQKQKELFVFLTKECDCTILKGYGADKNFSVDIQEDLSLSLYVIVPQSFVKVVRIKSTCDQELDAKFGIYPFDKKGRGFPLVQYERSEGIHRIYADVSTMEVQGKTAIKVILKKIKQWIKTNAASHYREGTPSCGITVYELI